MGAPAHPFKGVITSVNKALTRGKGKIGPHLSKLDVPLAAGRVPLCDKSLLFEIVGTEHLGGQIRELE